MFGTLGGLKHRTGEAEGEIPTPLEAITQNLWYSTRPRSLKMILTWVDSISLQKSHRVAWWCMKNEDTLGGGGNMISDNSWNQIYQYFYNRRLIHQCPTVMSVITFLQELVKHWKSKVEAQSIAKEDKQIK